MSASSDMGDLRRFDEGSDSGDHCGISERSMVDGNGGARERSNGGDQHGIEKDTGDHRGEMDTGATGPVCKFGGLCGCTYVKAVVGIMLLFALGLVFFFAFSADLGDGLERTMEEGDAGEESSGYEAPFGYGDDHGSAFVAGIIGFLVVLTVAIGYGKLRGRSVGASR